MKQAQNTPRPTDSEATEPLEAPPITDALVRWLESCFPVAFPTTRLHDPEAFALECARRLGAQDVIARLRHEQALQTDTKLAVFRSPH